ncbi:MAG: polysaccharide biosynthesis tyrosine autokinase [Gemmatimonadota bacterium]|nr:polysaccharide biosynthesis tyrosine autokinase [Gemmatimonadota bacterium]
MIEGVPSENIIPAERLPQHPLANWASPGAEAPAAERPPFERPIGAIRRYKWIALGVFLLGLVGGLVAIRFVKPQYEVRATIWIEPETPLSDATGPIRSHELLNSSAWTELLRSYRIVDAVVQKLALFVQPENAADFGAFSNFGIANRFVPGKYQLVVDRTRKTWKLALKDGTFADSGSVGDSVGSRVGLRWVIPSSLFEGAAKKTINFTVSTPRETAVELMKQLKADLPEKSNFLWLRFTTGDPQLGELTLNTWLKEYVSVASGLKKRNVVQFASTLNGQLSYAERSLHGAERALENFRVHTITLPAEGGPVPAGLEATRDPALKSFFDQKIEYDDTRQDRDALERVIAGAKTGTVPWEAELLIPSVAKGSGAAALRQAFDQLHTKQAELAAKRETYTDQHPAVQELAASVRTLQNQTIPQLSSQLLVQLKQREGQFQQRISGASREMQAIPTRTIEEMRLRRAVAVSEGLYTMLKSRSAEANLAEASATPDVTILDSAVAPLRPTRNTAPTVLLLAILGGLGAAIGIAILLDAFDPRVQYPDQVTRELGLSIAGAIPKFPRGGADSRSPKQLSQLIESIRTVRMQIQNVEGPPISIAVTSPSPGDGKSFVAANLAMSFSEAGFRTVLVDADTRRGVLHEMFQLPISPGLTEYLSSEESLTTVIRPTAYSRLWVMSRGARQKNSPELLSSPALPALAAELRGGFEVVVFDTPPLAAGIDAFAIASAARNLLFVLRIGQTNRRMASAKLELVDRLPVRIVGAVLNCVEPRGEFEYYKYSEGYDVTDETSKALVR